MKRLFPFLVLLLICGQALAQNQIQIFTNAQTIDPDRYKGIQGEPMLFKDWQKGVIIDNKDSVYTNISLNYNGFEEEFEVLKAGSTFIALNNKYYKRIEIESDQAMNGKLIFEKSDDPKFKGKFLQVIHKSDKVQLYKYFEARKGENVVQDVGKTRTFENFKKVSTYYIQKDGRLRVFRTKKKALIEELGQKKALESYIKKQKLKLSNDKDLQKLLAHCETL